MSKKNSIKNAKIYFTDSMSADGVTGSCVYIKTPNHCILFDCGLYQSNDRYESFLINRRKTKEFKPKDIDLIFLSHSHIDHIGKLPLLFAKGCKAKIFTTKETAALLPVLLNDSAQISERDATLINTQHETKYDPLYTKDDVALTLSNVVEIPFGERIILDSELSFEFYPNAHLLGSASIKLYLSYGNTTRTLLYTGDIGNNKIYNPYVGEFSPVKNADYVIAECTYGDRPMQKNGRKERRNDLSKLKTIVDTQVKENGGRVLIPSFAQSRTQLLVYFLHELYAAQDWQPDIYVDSPLACKIFNLYKNMLDGDEADGFERLLSWQKLHLISTPEDSMSLVESNNPCVIISCSGFCTAGRVRHHIKKLVSDSNATILFVGYSSDGSLASILKDPKRKEIDIDHKSYKCRCNVYTLKSFSGHAMFEQLLDYYADINTEKIILHHGSTKAKECFASALRKRLEEKCSSARVVVSNPSLKCVL